MTRRGFARDAVDAAFVRALERDRNREAVDRAKKRAALQRCDYNSFHQLVLGANLRAIPPRDSVSIARSDDNRTFQDCDRGRVPIDDVPLSSSQTVNVRLTGSHGADEFIRAWRRGCGDDDAKKTELLFSVSANEFERAFKVSRKISLAIPFTTRAGGAQTGLAHGLCPFDSRSSGERASVSRSRRRNLVRFDALRTIRCARTIGR